MRSLTVTAWAALLQQSHATAIAVDFRHYVFDGCQEKPGNFHNGTTRAAALDGYDTAAVRCCKPDGSTCETDVNGLCNSGKTFAEAKSICETNGWRLCTLPELETGICCGTGCDYDYMTQIWTSTPAPPRWIRNLCDTTGKEGGPTVNYTVVTETAMAKPFCYNQNTGGIQKCTDYKYMMYSQAEACCAGLGTGWGLPDADSFNSFSHCGPSYGNEQIWLTNIAPGIGSWMAVDGCKVRNYGSNAKSAGGKDYYYNTFEKHAVRCCSYDGGDCETATRFGCESAATWWEANEACHERGKRLCTASEMEDYKCCVTGCMFDVDKVWTSSFNTVYRSVQKNETGDSCNYIGDIGATSSTPYGIVCCGANSKCVDPTPNTCTKTTVSEAHKICGEVGLEVCRDSRLCSRCKSTKCYQDGEYLVGTKSYVS